MNRFIALVCLLLFASVSESIAGERPDEPRLNVRDFGASGDGNEHPVTEWIQAGRYSSLRALRKKIPDVTERWSTDEAAFELAKRALPAEGGTIYFPSGTYVATARAWTVLRDHLRLVGDGAEKSILMTGPGVKDGLVLAGYRHTGWSKPIPFLAEDGAQGTASLRLREPDASTRFRPGQLVFVRNGANRYDQDYGEMNEVRGVTADGQIQLVHPLARDYTIDRLNWAGKTAEGFAMPSVGHGVRVVLAAGPGLALPSRGETVSLATDLFRVESVSEPSTVRLVNLGQGNNAAGTTIPPGTLVAKGRGLVILAETVRDFRCEKITLRGRRKALTLSNSYNTAFVDCVIERRPGDAAVSGGIVIDGDDGRRARFVRCDIRADPSCGMQFARSFGDVAFERCRLLNTNVAFTEFNFRCVVTGCTFEVVGGPDLGSVVIIGKSCDDLQIIGNTIKGRNLAVIFDAKTDIQSFKVRGNRAVVLRDNVVEADAVNRIYNLDPAVATVVSRNTIRGQYHQLGLTDVVARGGTESHE